MVKKAGTTKKCNKCRAVLNDANWTRSNRACCNYICKPCRAKYLSQREVKSGSRVGAHYSDPRGQTLTNARYRAKKKGLEFSLTYETCPPLPTHCPVLGVKLEYGGGNTSEAKSNSPSLDRIDNTKGYTPDNVIWVSSEANVIRGRSHWMKILRVGEFYRDLDLQRTRKEAA